MQNKIDTVMEAFLDPTSRQLMFSEATIKFSIM